MSNKRNGMHNEAIKRTLAQRAGTNPDVLAIADASISTWHQMAVRLAPMIGTHGVDVLFRRSLHVTSREFRWLATVEHHVDSAGLLASLQVRLTEQQNDIAANASEALLVTFTDLLTSLIGPSLTERLFATLWAPPAPDTEKDSTA